MRKRLYALAAATLLLSLLSACTKDDGPEDPRPGYRRSLVSGPWQLSTYMIYKRADGGRIDTTNVFKSLKPCAADDLYFFRSIDSSAEGELIVDEGLTRCDSTSPQQRTGISWSIPNAIGKSFVITEGRIGDIYKLETLSDTVLRLTQDEQYDPHRNQVNSKLIIYTKVR